jgi:hypothetical protein
MKKILTALASAGILAVSTASPVFAAGSTSFSVAASSTSYTQGNTVTVSVYENGSNINTVKAVLSFDASKLSCAGIGASSSFPTDTPSTGCSAGTVTISRGTTSPANGNVLVGTVSFTAVASGSSSVSLTSAKAYEATTGTDTWNGAASSTSFSVSAPATTTPPTTGGSTGGSTGSTGSTGTTKTTTTSTSSTKATTPAAAGSTTATTSTGQVEGASTTTPSSDTATTDSTTKSTDGGDVVKTENAASTKTSNTGAWVGGSIAAVLVVLVGVYFLLTRRYPDVIKNVTKKINL